MDTLKLRMKQRLKGQTKTQRRGAFPDISTENFEIIHKVLEYHSTQPIWIFLVYMMYKTCFLWEPSTLHPHGSFMNNLQNSWGQDSKRRERAPLLITSRKGNKGSLSTTEWCSLLRRDYRTDTESTNSASVSYLKGKIHTNCTQHNPNTHLMANCHPQFRTENCKQSWTIRPQVESRFLLKKFTITKNLWVFPKH
jgi:hypothetical protein